MSLFSVSLGSPLSGFMLPCQSARYCQLCSFRFAFLCESPSSSILWDHGASFFSFSYTPRLRLPKISRKRPTFWETQSSHGWCLVCLLDLLGRSLGCLGPTCRPAGSLPSPPPLYVLEMSVCPCLCQFIFHIKRATPLKTDKLALLWSTAPTAPLKWALLLPRVTTWNIQWERMAAACSMWTCGQLSLVPVRTGSNR